MKILITGGLGYLGSHTCIDLLKKGYKVIIIDNLSNSSEKVLEGIKKISGKKPKFIKCDIRDQSRLIQIFKDSSPQYVIHFAGLKSVTDSLYLPLDYFENNVTGTINLLKAMDASECKNIVFSSSATVYGIPEYCPCDEKHPTNPTNPYGNSKLISEKIISDWVNTSPGLKALIFRYFNPAGAHSSGLIGESPIGRANNLMPVILDVASGKKDNLLIFGDDYNTRDGTGLRDYIHVSDLSLAHVVGLEKLEKFDQYTILNLGTGRNYSIYEVIDIFENTNNVKIKSVIASRREGDLAEVWASNNKAKNLLGIEFNRQLDEICKDAYRWSLNNL